VTSAELLVLAREVQDGRELDAADAQDLATAFLQLVDRIQTVADENFGPFPIQTPDENVTAIERGAFDQRKKIFELEQELARRDEERLRFCTANTEIGGMLVEQIVRCHDLERTGDVSGAIAEWARARDYDPTDANAYDDLVTAIERGDWRTPPIGTRFYVASSADRIHDVDLLSKELVRRGMVNAFAWPAHFTHKCGDGCGVQDRADLAARELAAAASCDLFIGIARLGKGAHAELGAALSSGRKRVILVGVNPRDSVFYDAACIEHAATLEDVLCMIGAM
jgi:hypothetical protein